MNSSNSLQRSIGVAVLTASLMLVLVLAGASSSTAARDRQLPRIAAAALEDVDRDSRADRLRLTYSERIRHARDADGRYPFSVAGHRIRSVGAAAGRVIVISLVEPAAGAKAPAFIRYAKTRAKPVRDRAGNQAAAQAFKRISVRVTRPTQTPQPQPQPTTTTDRDGDGVADTQDCAPADPKIKPGAPDAPDLAFVDSNCDGIDGTESKAIFASPLGKDTNPGTKAAPKREIDAAVVAAAAQGKDVLAAVGLYQRVKAASGVGIYGGYDAKSWSRSTDLFTVISGFPEGIVADKATGVVLQLMKVRGTTNVLHVDAGTSFYGIRAINGSSLRLQRVSSLARSGEAGANGVSGQNGFTGGRGGDGQNGQCDGSKPGGGGAGGTSQAGRSGGPGGSGGRDIYGTAGRGVRGGTGARWNARRFRRGARRSREGRRGRGAGQRRRRRRQRDRCVERAGDHDDDLARQEW